MENELPALIGIDISVAAIWEAMMNMFIMLAVTIILITSIGIGVHYRVLERTLIQPIVTLKTGADELVGKLDSEEVFVSDIHTGDEIEALAHSVEEMDRSLKQKTRELVEITAEQRRSRSALIRNWNSPAVSRWICFHVSSRRFRTEVSLIFTQV